MVRQISFTVTLLSLLLSSALSVGCDSCERRRPYTPFLVDAAAVPSTTASAAETPSISPPQPPPIAQPVEGRKLEPPLGRFELGPRLVELPKDLAASRVLEKPSTVQPGQVDALVWVVPAKPSAEWNGPMGELWRFVASADAKKVFSLPAWMPSGPDCLHDVRLAQIGNSTFLIDVRARCERSLPQRTPNRAVVLVAPDSPQPLSLGLRVAEPAPDESMNVTAVVSDRDGDSREDPSVRFDFEVQSAKIHASAEFGWLDRTAGASIDESHFTASLEPTFLAWEGALGKKPKLAGVLTETTALRRLLSAICQQSAAARVFDWRGEPFRCPSMSQVATRLARLEVRAALGLGAPLEASHALGVATTWHGGIPSAEREDLRKRIAKSLAKVTVGAPVLVSVRPASSPEPVHYSPLRFDDEGSGLLVQTGHGKVERVSLDGTGAAEADTDAAVMAWPLAVTAADGRRWSSVVPACDRSELSLALKGADGILLPLVATSLLAPRPGVCRNPAPWPTDVGPISWQGDAPIALIDGVCWPGPPPHACPTPDKLGHVVQGSPRSPDGSRMIVVTSLGPVVMGGAKPELWTGSGLDGKHLHDCVVSNGAKAVACIANADVILFIRPEAATN
jgi:hypothetical protein